MHESLGRTYTDKISGVTGVATGHVEYITGCSQTLLQPRSLDGKPIEPSWVDDQRLTPDDSKPRIELNNGATPGFDREAPKR